MRPSPGAGTSARCDERRIGRRRAALRQQRRDGMLRRHSGRDPAGRIPPGSACRSRRRPGSGGGRASRRVSAFAVRPAARIQLRGLEPRRSRALVVRVAIGEGHVGVGRRGAVAARLPGPGDLEMSVLHAGRCAGSRRSPSGARARPRASSRMEPGKSGAILGERRVLVGGPARGHLLEALRLLR